MTQITAEAVKGLLEQYSARCLELDRELADVDAKIREREDIRSQIAWLQTFPGLGDNLASYREAIGHAAQQVAAETDIPQQHIVPDVSSSEAYVEAAAEAQAKAAQSWSQEEVRKLKLPELKALAKELGLEVKGNKADYVEAVCEELFDVVEDAASEDEPAGDPAPGFSDEVEEQHGPADPAPQAAPPATASPFPQAAPAPQPVAQPQVAPEPQAQVAPQVGRSPFSF